MVTVGIDEVGRGCWAGPLVAGAVVLGKPIAELRDSKKLTKKRREELSEQILASARAVGFGWVSAQDVDAVGLSEAVRLAMQRALDQITVEFDVLIIDGNINYFPADARAKAIVKADDSVPAVSAASIVAKVARDNWMAKQAQNYPEYQFDRHVGYGTALHIKALQDHGVCALHRQSYKPIKVVMGLAL